MIATILIATLWLQGSGLPSCRILIVCRLFLTEQNNTTWGINGYVSNEESTPGLHCRPLRSAALEHTGRHLAAPWLSTGPSASAVLDRRPSVSHAHNRPPAYCTRLHGHHSRVLPPTTCSRSVSWVSRFGALGISRLDWTEWVNVGGREKVQGTLVIWSGLILFLIII